MNPSGIFMNNFLNIDRIPKKTWAILGEMLPEQEKRIYSLKYPECSLILPATDSYNQNIFMAISR